jgi:DNA-directed RNA polymerase subunit K/omega
MAETDEVVETPEQSEEVPAPRQKAAPIESRFLFVDVAAMRAKQLRRGALPRLNEDDHAREPHRPVPHKAERVAMEEVRHGLVQYEIPEFVRKDPRA